MENKKENARPLNPEKDPQSKQNPGRDDLDSPINTDFGAQKDMKSLTDDEDPDQDPNEVPDKPGFTPSK